MKLLLVDLSSLFHRVFHAVAGEDADSAHRNVTAKIRTLVAQYDHHAICCDAGSKTFRHELSADYKANRAEKDPALIAQLKRTQQSLADDGFHVFSVPGVEADDLVATFVRQMHTPVDEIVVYSADKDLLQLLTYENVRQLSVSTDTLMGPSEVIAKFGVSPGQMRDYLALVGDASDNIKGISGCGPKTAVKLLQRFGTASGIYANLDAKDDSGEPIIKPACRKALESEMAQFDLAWRLVGLKYDVDVDCESILKKKEPVNMANVSDADFEEEAPVKSNPPSVPPPALVRSESPAPAAAAAPKPVSAEMVVASKGELLDPRDPRYAAQLAPRDLREAWGISKTIHSSRLFPDLTSAESVMAIIMTGREMGLGPMVALRSLRLVKGKVEMAAALMSGMTLQSGKAEYWDLVESTDKIATFETKRVGGRRAVSMSYSIEEARQAGLVTPGSNWEKRPKTMLRWRATAELARAVYPDICVGLYVFGEIDQNNESIEEVAA